MKTVPTLCASATVVGVSSAGLALGHPESHRPATPFARPDFDRASSRLLPSRPSTAVAAPTPPSLLPSPVLDGADGTRLNNEHAPMRRPRGLTLESVNPRLRLAEEAGKRLSGLDQDAGLVGVDGRDSTRARRSWVKRLSMVSISQGSTRTTASVPSPLSLAFSLDGSSASMIPGSAPPPPLPPNKLVKRTTSVRDPAVSEQRPPSSSRSTLRRPATSHQRSRTLGSRPAFMDLAPDYLGASQPFEPEFRWRQYFSIKGTAAKRRGLSGDPKVITRIVPSEKHHPTLVMANAVTTPALEIEDAFSLAGDSDGARTRPHTPAFIDLAPQSPAAGSETPAEALACPETGQEADNAKRRFSISDLLGTGTLTRKSLHRRRLSTDRFARANSRLSTATTASTHDGSGAMANGNLEVLPNRRDERGPIDSPVEIQSSYSSHNDDVADISFESSRPSSSQIYESRVVSQSNASNHIPSRVSSQHGYAYPTTRPVSHRPASPSSGPIRLSRYSVTSSEQASTLVGSDNEARLWSGEESDTDFQSDTVFDSMRTRGTRASSGARGPNIGTIFDAAPPPPNRKVSPLRDLLPKGTFPEFDKHSMIQEEESNFSTPVRSIVPKREHSGSPTPAARTNSAFPPDIPSSPPKPLNLGTLAWDNSADDGDDSRWSFDDDDSDIWDMSSDRTPNMHYATKLALKRSNPVLIGTNPSPISVSTVPRLSADTYERDARSSIFDWSESVVADLSVGKRTPPRPNTVHGKKDGKARGSRSAGRRVPSGLHARSQSVPVVPDVAGNRDAVVTNKFGTWGVGSKGVTEDWNDDFDFSGCDDGFGETNKPESPSAMFVPESIREQQTSVLANIGLLKEWGILIEELKELKARAANLNILDGTYKLMWQEVEAMIDLADQEADEPPHVPHLSPASSHGFDAEAFDEPITTTPRSSRSRGRSLLHTREGLGNGASPVLSTYNKGRRKSILVSTDDIFSCPSPAPKTPQDTPQATPVGRPRKNSEALARSVIEALQQRRNAPDLHSHQAVTPTKKVPFDNRTLKHIVPYVNGLKRQAKDALRETEHLYSSPTHTPTNVESSFSHIFNADPSDESPSSRRSRPRSRMTLSEKAFDAKDTELVATTQQMKLMTVM